MTNAAIEQFIDKIDADGAGLHGYNAVIQFHFKDTEETYNVAFEGDSAKVIDNDTNSDCTITTSSKNFEKLTTGQLNPQTAFLMGKLKSKGDMSHLLKLSGILTYYK